MDKKIVALILVILISFCCLSIVVADNATQDDNTPPSDDSTVDGDDSDDDDTSDDDKKDTKKNTDKNKKKNKNKTDDKKGDVTAKGSGNDIIFSDGFRGFILDYSKSPAKSGDQFNRASSSHADNSNTLKQAVIECYRHHSADRIGSVISSIVKTGSAGGKIGDAIAKSNEKVSDHAVVKIDNSTEAVFNFEVLKSVSKNKTDYFAYKVSFRSINNAAGENQTNNVTNLTNTTNNITNATNATNITGLNQTLGNDTNATFLQALYDYLASLMNALYDSWKPIFDTLMNDFLMIATFIQGLTDMYNNFMAELQSLIDAIHQLIAMLDSIWKELAGLLNLILNAIQQLINLIMSIINAIIGLISYIIGLIQWLIGLLYALIDFLTELINQLTALIQAIIDFLKSIGSFLVNVIGNAVILVVTFVAIAIGAFVYNRIR